MGEYIFLSSWGRVSAANAKRAQKIARRHGATFRALGAPEQPRVWFSAPSRGAPFDAVLRSAVEADLRAAGLLPLTGDA